MIVIARNTEDKLLEDLRECRERNPSQRCFYLAFSALEIPRKELFENFLRLLHDIPDSYMAQVYICRDSDVFILLQGFMLRQFQDFVKKLSESLREERIPALSDVMEVGVHWAKLETMCRRKIENSARKRREEDDERKGSGALLLEALSSLDPDQVASLSARRRKRRQPLVMIVDDDQITRMIAGNVIMEQCEWTYARDGQGALPEYLSSAPDVLFLDIGLPDASGHDVLESVFRIDPGAYVIMLSGRKDRENVMKSLEAGASGFIGKPFTRERLFHYIERSPHVLEKRDGGKTRERKAR